MRARKVENVQDDANPPVIGKLEPSVRGYAWLLRRQDLSMYMLVCLSLTLLVQATITLFVVRAVTLGLGDGGVGLFYAAVAAGCSRRQHRRGSASSARGFTLSSSGRDGTLRGCLSRVWHG